MNKPKLVVLSGAGISAESGLQTFRGMDGLWEGHRVEDVASPEGFARDPALVQSFYNTRRDACRKALPNQAHKALVALEEFFDVTIITQNIDDLHERAGSKNIVHLHGEILKAQSTKYPYKVYDLTDKNIDMGDLCPDGSPLRPHVVWFGEAVPEMTTAIQLTKQADVLIVVGTSLQVYPAANLIYEVKSGCKIYVVDPNADKLNFNKHTTVLAEKATIAMPKLFKMLTE